MDAEAAKAFKLWRFTAGTLESHPIPLIVGVPYRNLDQWRHFAAGLSDECEVSHAAVTRWLAAKGFATSRDDFDEPREALRR